uniref:ATP synthase F0 subunit 6 n=1 Tax=Lepidotrema longipenis TaxID=330067 RepID=A0A346Q022_9PLAT|nr:ATP synthase F0 subunit 6 [Lepidotrema longipenis]AXR86348.1 ATP synthase F0 subunit 6 [Lepidotrema longipenis]
MILNTYYLSSSLFKGVFGKNENNIFQLFLFFLLIVFLFLRIPFIYGSMGFFSVVFLMIIPLFLSLFFIRLEFSLFDFFSSLIPGGTPLWIAPLVGVAETISYIVRPFVLIIRPFLNITIGAIGVAAVGGMSFSISGKMLILFMSFLFFYEVFVAIVHWFIVVNILLFSKDH